MRDCDSEFGLLIPCCVTFLGPKALLLRFDLNWGRVLLFGVAPMDYIGGEVACEVSNEIGESDFFTKALSMADVSGLTKFYAYAVSRFCMH